MVECNIKSPLMKNVNVILNLIFQNSCRHATFSRKKGTVFDNRQHLTEEYLNNQEHEGNSQHNGRTSTVIKKKSSKKAIFGVYICQSSIFVTDEW